MKVKVLSEKGYFESLYGLGLSYGITSNIDFKEFCRNTDSKFLRMSTVAKKLCEKDNGHNKFLESMVVWIDIVAPRYWHCQLDTYRIGVSKLSESTMHTILHRKLTQEDFVKDIPRFTLDTLNDLIEAKQFHEVKNLLPEGYLQQRLITTNYKSLRHIINQRKTHKLVEWQIFCDQIIKQVRNPEFLANKEELEELCLAA